MAFEGCKFTFDGVSCDEHQLLIYNIGDNQQGDIDIAHTVSIQEQYISNRWKPLFFGVTYENKLESEIIFGLTQDRIDRHEYLSRQEIAAVSSWLAGHQQYKWLEIEQSDLAGIRYRCMVTSLKVVEYDGLPWAFSAVFTCDSPYAYLYPEEYTYDVEDELVVTFHNKSDHNGYYRPIITFSPGAAILTDDATVLTEENNNVLITGSSMSIENITCGHRMEFTALPEGVDTVTVNCETGVITSNTQGNLYEYFNFRFLQLQRGANVLKFSGRGSIKICCEFPVSVGM